MTRTFKTTHPRARLEAQFVGALNFSPGFTLMHYEHRRADDRWWQRTITATDAQWLRLSGRDGSSPHDTWSKLLDYRERAVIPLPMLVLGDFVAYAANQAQTEARWLFQWVAWALDDLIHISPLPRSTRGGTTVEPEMLEIMACALIDGVLDEDYSISWPETDGAQLQTLVHLGKLLWSFPPDLVRRLVEAFVTFDERGTQQADTIDDQQTDSQFVGPGQLVQLSGIYLWRSQIPHVRRLSFHISTMAFPALFQQALILTHPDAPHIDDTDLGRLCDGAIGQAADPPTPVQSAYHDVVNLPAFAPSEARARIATYAEEAGTKTSGVPVGQWDIPVSSRLPLFRACDLRALRVMTCPDGCWVRLLPPGAAWGKLLWWVPQLEPPACLAFALGTGRNHPFAWAVHETMWMLWRDLRSRGVPDA